MKIQKTFFYNSRSDGARRIRWIGSSYSPWRFLQKMLLDYSEKYGLIVTGGSDYHGEFGLIKDDYLGKGGISYEEFLQIKEAIFL